MAQIKGFDVSSWQHPSGKAIDWKKAKEAGFEFVMIKSSQGLGYVNPHFKADALAAHQAGLLVGAYHYAEPAEGTAQQEALHAVAAVAGAPLTMGLALDLEEYGSLSSFQVPQWAQEFMTEVNAAEHNCPFYCGGDFLATLTGAPWGHRFWNAGSSVPAGMNAWMQQHPNETVEGVVGTCDVDYLLTPRGVNPSVPEPEPTKPPTRAAGPSAQAPASENALTSKGETA